MEGICLNLLEATVALYPANPDGTPQLTSPVFFGAEAESLRATESWLKKETRPSGVPYPRRHLLVPTYAITIGRVWALPADTALDWLAQYQKYVLDVVWVEDDPDGLAVGPRWHRKTFYGVTITEHGWDGRDVANGFMEGQQFEAEYMVPDGGLNYTGQPILPATLPYRVLYTDATGSVLLYTYTASDHTFIAQTATAARATITTSPFAIQFAGDAAPVVSASTAASLAYRKPAFYRSANTYRQNALICAGIFAQPPLPGDLPRLDFYYGAQKVFAVNRAGIFETDFIEAEPGAPGAGGYGVYGGANALLAVFTRGNLTATQIQVTA